MLVNMFVLHKEVVDTTLTEQSQREDYIRCNSKECKKQKVVDFFPRFVLGFSDFFRPVGHSGLDQASFGSVRTRT